MRFDPISFLLGFLSATGLSLVLWRIRRRLAEIQETAGTQIEGTRQFFGRAADKRYVQDLQRYLEQRHVAGHLFNLSEALLEPRLIAAPGPLTPRTDYMLIENIFDLVPMFHDLPQSYAPYNIETMALNDLGAGDRHVAILGIKGLGKSTALTTLALMALGKVSFETLATMTEQAIQEEEGKLSDEQRKQRAQERARIQQQAIEKLDDARRREREQLGRAAGPEEDRLPPLKITELLPILVHLSALEFDVAAYGKDEALDPVEPLIRAVQREVSAVTAQVVGSVLYPAIEKGRALILLDGYDEISPSARQTYFFWLQQLLSLYGQNLIVIVGPVEGYESLANLGFTPTYLRPWRKEDYDLLAKRWSKAWSTSQEADLPDEHVMRQISVDNQGRTILDTTLKIWTGLAGDARLTGRPGWYEALATRQLSNAELRGVLPALAARLLEAGQPLERAVLQEELEAILAEAASQGDQKAAKADEVLESLIKDGLLVGHGNSRHSFAHPQIISYLASETLVKAGPERATEVALDTAWQDALAFAAAQIDMTSAFHQKLSTSLDLLYSALFDLARWLPDAPLDALWRGDLFKRLAAALMAPEQYPTVRARAMAASIASRDRKSALFILRQAIRIPDPYIRRLACIGMGALGDPDVIKDLSAMITDENREVQLAAGLALGAIGNDAALDVMARGLLEGVPELRRAIAEALAAIPEEGHQFLREGIRDPDIEVRRAAVYGLSRIKAPWALSALYRAMLEDEQWYVRTAAEDAFMAARSPEHEGPLTHPEADKLVWLVKWAADHGEGTPAGPNARQMLVRMLQEGAPVHQMIAAQTLGRLGHVAAIKPLYAALLDRSPDVRGAAYEALADLQVRLGESLPGLT
jgi:HEAT repeat protein